MATVTRDINVRALKIAGNDVYGIHVANELINQHGEKIASEIFDMLEARGLKGGDLYFVFDKVKEIEHLGKMVNPWDDVGRAEVWKEVLNNSESWAESLKSFREWNSNQIRTGDA